MTNNYDVIIIGGGHNGLVTAAYLAKAGRRALVLERRDMLGGAAATEEVFPGFKFNTGAVDAGLFRPEIVSDLGLEQHGLEFISSEATAFAPQPDGTAITLWRDRQKTSAEIAPLSERDAVRYPRYCELVTKLARVLDGIMTLTPPDIGNHSLGELFPWGKLALKVRGLGKHDMMEFLRVLPMTAVEFMAEWFESEALKGLLGAAGVTGSMQGPQASGTAFMMLTHYLGEPNYGFKAGKFVRGGMGRLSEALANVARQYGVEIRTGAEVAQITVEDDCATGVKLASGEEILAGIVVSNADPRRTLFGLVGAPTLEMRIVRRVKNIRFKGSTAKVNLALSGLPQFTALQSTPEMQKAKLSGHIIVCPSLEYLERAYDEAKYGGFSKRPYLDVTIPTVLDPSLAPEGKHVVSITMQYAPYHLRESTWDEQREALGDTIINTLAEYAPNLPDLILHRQIMTPLDWERDVGLTEGSIFHGQMGLDQLLFMRPIAGYGQYRSPVEKLYLCGAGTHPGGGVTGAPGYNAAREILKD